MACLSTVFAMLYFMLSTLISASFAYLGTYFTQLRSVLSINTHYLCSSVANRCAFHIQLNAVGHHGHIFFLKAGGSTIITGGGTTETSVYAILISVIHHLAFNVRNASAQKPYEQS
jgi:hypothetical protein